MVMVNLIGLFILGTLQVGCGGSGRGDAVQPTPIVSHGGPVRDYVSFVDALRAAGAAVKPVGALSQPFFSVPGQVIEVNAEDVQVFEYSDAAAAQAAAKDVAPNGSSIGTTMVSWIAPPHFYKKERLIVLYLGTNVEVIAVLEKALGPQIAGR